MEQVQSYIEYFEDDCKDAIHWMAAYNFFAGFTEGWTTYVEYKLLPQGTKLYSDRLDKEVLLQKYGMIYYQVSTRARGKQTLWVVVDYVYLCQTNGSPAVGLTTVEGV